MICLLLGSIIGMSILDLVGIAVIFPYLVVVSDPSAVVLKYAPFLSELIQKVATREFIALLSAGLIVFYFLKNFIQIRLMRYQFKSTADLTRRITDDTIALVLNARYATFQKIPASEIVGVASSNTVHATLVFQAILQILNEAIFLGLLLLATLRVYPLIGLFSLALMSLLAGSLYFFVIRRTELLGMVQATNNRKRYELQFLIVSAIRDIKVMGLAALFDRRSRDISTNLANASWQYSLNGAAPRLLIELFMVIGFVCAVVLLVLRDIQPMTMVPIFGVIAITAVRAIPSFSRFIMGVNAIRYSAKSLADLIDMHDVLNEASHIRYEDFLTFNNSIELRNIYFQYDGKNILDDVSIKINRGSSIGIVGPSGSGKTTLLDVLTGLQPAISGSAFADGKQFDPFESSSLERLVGYVPQVITLVNESIAFNIAFDRAYDPEHLRSVLKVSNLEEFVLGLPDGVETFVGEDGLRLSGGQRQRIGIARALYRRPELLVFDEATSALDTISEKELSTEIERLRNTISVVIVAHRLSTVVNCDVIYVLENGSIVDSGTHGELLGRCELYREMHHLQGEMEQAS